MDLAEYTQGVLTTAQPRAYSLDYLVPMIAGEIGEMFGHRAKGFWHGKSEDEIKAELVFELGDVAWGTALLLYVQGWSPEGSGNAEPSAIYFEPGFSDPWDALITRARYLVLWHNDITCHFYFASEAKHLWGILRGASEILTGQPFDHVLQANLDKLKSRAARNVLQGNGDHR